MRIAARKTALCICRRAVRDLARGRRMRVRGPAWVRVQRPVCSLLNVFFRVPFFPLCGRTAYLYVHTGLVHCLMLYIHTEQHKQLRGSGSGGRRGAGAPHFRPCPQGNR